jgi:hypothetical protein
MKKIDFKYGLLSTLLLFLALIIKGILDGMNASAIMYTLAWIPVIIGFVYDFNYLWKRIRKV